MTVNRADFTGNHWYFLWIDDLFEAMSAPKNDTKNTSHEISYPSENINKPIKIKTVTYTSDDVNIYVTGNGSQVADKVNVELMPEHKMNDKSNPNIKIYDSHKIRNTKNQREILQIVMSNPLYDSTVFFRTENSYVTEWKAHNLLYDLAFFSDYLQKKFGDVDLDNDEVIAWDINW